MRMSFIMPHSEDDLVQEFCSAEGIKEIAIHGEALGYDGLALSEHPIPGIDTFAYGGHNQVDPIVTLSIAGAVTKKLHLQTNLLVLPYRNPFLTAKSIATLDYATGGRVKVGVGAGYGEAEFKALGVNFDERNELTDEAIEVMKQTWTGEVVKIKGRHFEAPGNVALPRPAQNPHPPIWIGGNSKRAMRRAVTLADGWAPFPNPPEIAAKRRSLPLWAPEEVKLSVAYIREQIAAAGRTKPLEIVFMPYQLVPDAPCPDPAATIDTAGKLKEAGVTYFTCAISGPRREKTRAAFLSNMEWLAKNILPGFNKL